MLLCFAGINLNRENKTLFSDEGAIFNRLCQYTRLVLQISSVDVCMSTGYGVSSSSSQNYTCILYSIFVVI